MSWDITVQRFSKRYACIAEIPDNEECMALGSNAEVRAAISQFFFATDWSDPTWGIFESGTDSVEFNIGTDDPNSGFMMHVRASNRVVPIIVAMCQSERWQALDCSEGCFLEKSSKPEAGLEKLTAYRNQIVRNG
jgi:hypothetical protein